MASMARSLRYFTAFASFVDLYVLRGASTIY